MINKILKIIVIILSIIFFIYGLMIKGVGSGTKFYLVWIILSILSLLLFFMLHYKLFDKIPIIFKKILFIVFTIILIIFLVSEFLIISKMYIKEKNNLDYIIVLGAQVYENRPSSVLKYRLDKAITYLNENPNTLCIVSGGQGDNEPFSEGYGMKEYLVKNNINENRIIIEDKSKSTKENLIYSNKIINDKTKTIGIVTNNFHMYRALLIAKKENINAYGVVASSKVLYLPNNLLREFLALIKYYYF